MNALVRHQMRQQRQAFDAALRLAEKAEREPLSTTEELQLEGWVLQLDALNERLSRMTTTNGAKP